MRSFLPLFLALTGCGTLTVDDGRAELAGRLVDRSGAAVVGAHVMLIRDRRPVADTHTGADGRFVLASTPGPAALFALADQTGDDGAWRDGLDLRAAGRTDVGELELEKVWAHPDVLWLRGAGYDEQLTRPDDGLEYLWGGRDGEPLLVAKYLRTHVQVFRIFDDGSSVLLLDEPWADPYANVPAPGDPPPPVLQLRGTRDAQGRPLLLAVEGGFTWVSIAGTVVSPITRLRWFELDHASVVLEVNIPSGAWCDYEADRGALVVSGDRSTWFDLASGRQTEVEADLSGDLVTVGDGVFALAFGPTSVTAWRIDGRGGVAHGPAMPRLPGSYFQTLSRGEDEVLALWLGEALSFIRIDARTLEGRVESTVLPQHRGLAVLPSCVRSGQTPVTIVAGLDASIVAVRLDQAMAVHEFPFEGPFFGAGCTLEDGFWASTNTRPQVALRAVGPALEVTPLGDGAVAWLGLGARPLVSRVVDGVRLTGVGADGRVSPLAPIGRSPFMTTITRNLDDDRSFIATGLVGQGQSALFRVRP